MFLPMAWYYFVGGVRALFGVYSGFHRTPKGKDAYRQIMPRINSVLLLGEIITFFYSLFAAYVALSRGNYFLVPLNVTVCAGFGMVLFWSWREANLHRNAAREVNCEGMIPLDDSAKQSSQANSTSLAIFPESRRENGTSAGKQAPK